MITREHYIDLLNKMREGTISPGEAIILMDAVSGGQYKELTQDIFEGHLMSDELQDIVDVQTKERGLHKLRKVYGTEPIHNARVHRVHFLRTAWFRVAVAVLIILTGVFIYDQFLRISKTGANNNSAAKTLAKSDILPGSDKAILTLSDGSKIELNNAASETITDGNLAIKNTNGQLVYGSLPIPSIGGVAPGGANSNINPSGPGAGVGRGAPLFNTMTTPRGGQYQLILPDGSRVWLNAESSITFPTAFTQNVREVKITGEAYFEIKANKQIPFIVKTISDEIQVLGTSFNITAYNNAPVKTSLLEGSVRIKDNILKPGQASINGKIITTDLAQDIAWKNGLFNFNDVTLEQAMIQIVRWYDIKVEYIGKVPSITLGGEMGRKLTLNEVLESLKTLGVNAKLENRILKIYS